MRTGLWASGAGGSGIIVGRLPDGSWSPPSGIMLHTVGLGFLVGVDIYDCVMVINTQEALQGFARLRCTIGGELSAVAGPVGIGGVLESEVHKRQAPIFTYLKSRGFYAGVQIDGTIVLERNDENERFYGVKITVGEILGGSIPYPPREIQTLMQTLKAAQGDKVDESELPGGPAPSDHEIVPSSQPAPTSPNSSQLFGIPDKYDPDPYGINELADSGFQLKEAGTHKILPRESFIFNPSPSSPVFNAFNRNSLDSRSMSAMSRRSSWRTSTISTATQTIDMATQTDFDTPATSPYSSTSSGKNRMNDIMENSVDDSAWLDKAPEKKTDVLPVADAPEQKSEKSELKSELATVNESAPEKSAVETSDTSVGPTHLTGSLHNQLDIESDDDEEEEDVYVQTVHQVVTPKKTFMARAQVVTVNQLRAPPQLPPRNPVRDRKRPLVITGINNNPSSEESQDAGTSPMSSSHRSSVVSSTEVPVAESNASFTSVELSRQGSKEESASGRRDSVTNLAGHAVDKEETEKTKDAKSQDSDTDGDFHSTTATPAVAPSSPVAAHKTLPGSFE
jgi:lipid-binding SYLF domain-containing protein